MTSLIGRNVSMAIKSIRTTKLRSLLTMIGIIIGVASVITAVSLGEGLRKQISGNVKTGAKDVLTVRPGKLVNRDSSGHISSINFQAAIGSSSLNDQDMQSTSKLPSVKSVTPLSTISALASIEEGRQLDSIVIGTGPEFADISGQEVAYGNFFSSSDKNVAVIGKAVAEQLFQENVPIGQSLKLRGHEFIVSGIFSNFSANAFTNGGDLNGAIFIPYETAKSISGNSASIYQLLIRPEKNANTSDVSSEVTKALTKSHGDQQDFTVLTQAETLQLTSKTLSALTSFIAGIAAISLIVGGIGIMNIMFVSVTERTREIGVRKSLGATNRQIYGQFLTEATIISFVGGVIGVLFALFTNYCFRVFTSLSPVATWPIIGVSVLVSMAVGMVFGTAPAIKAARKDPIQSLRHE